MYGGGGGLVAKSCPTLEVPWTEEPGRLQSIGFSRQEHWSGLPFSLCIASVFFVSCGKGGDAIGIYKCTIFYIMY